MSREDVPRGCRGTWVCDCSYCIEERRYDYERRGYPMQDPTELDEHQRVPVELRDPCEVALEAAIEEARDTERCPPPWELDNDNVK